MEGLMFPIIMLTVTLLGGGILLFILNRKKPGVQTDEQTLAMKTAQDFINVKDIRDRYLYTRDGSVLVYLRIHAISIDLYSKAEKNNLIRQLTAELSDVQYPFKFLAVSRPVDISPLITDMQGQLKAAEECRKELLRQEILQMSSFALSGEIVERQFYISLWDKHEEGNEKDLYRRAMLLAEKFTTNGIGADVLKEQEIIRLLNLIHNPSYIHLEDTDVSAAIPFLNE
ncbi:MAG: hypothetical protein ACRDBO_04095 [Lachnospiraceae bacterium]